MSLLTSFRAIWRPDMYHGHGRRRNFFEGWYFKFADAAGQNVLAVIPGVFWGQTPETSHAFVQILEGRTGRSAYHRYPVEAFWASEENFEVRVGPNHFQADRIQLDIEAAELAPRGELQFTGLTPWPVTWLAPGIMSWYAFVPFMECYHGVVSLDHAVQGALTLDGQRVNFDGGRGYIEKDWGQAFPAAWVWMQTNHFAEPGVCLTASVATIPWLGTSFQGYIVGLWRGGQLHRFATYTGAKTKRLRLTNTQVVWHLTDARYRLELVAERTEGGLLHAPYRVEMQARVVESLTATVSVRLIELAGGREVFAGVGKNAGLEVNGGLAEVG